MINTRDKLTKGFKLIVLTALLMGLPKAGAQTNGPRLVDPNLRVRSVVTNLNQPINMAFLRQNDFLVLEKSSGLVKRVINGIVSSNVLDLAVNSASERGLLGITLHPRFPWNPWVYLFWTESSTGADSTNIAEVPLLGNRVDRFRWTGSALTFDRNIVQLRSFQMDAGQPLRGNHNGGVIRFGPDGKLYIYMGDQGRRGQMQNLPDGPGPAGNTADDQFGGPEPDDAHLTGVILRLNDDGSTPRSNPFFRAGALRGGDAGENLQKVFAFGIRNGFGMAFDPFSGNLWEAQNGDDSFTELNRVESGANLGWVQVMGPLRRLDQFKAIETSSNFFGLQQIRWSPTNIADSASKALESMFWVYEGGDAFGTFLTGDREVPPVSTAAGAVALFAIDRDGALLYELRATGPIQDATMAHIHLGGFGQNGPVVAFLLHPAGPTDFRRGNLIAAGRITDADVIAQPGFEPTLANLIERLRQGRAYVNLHTVSFPGGEVRGQIRVIDSLPVSHYSGPEFSWKYEVAPAAVGFISSTALGNRYQGDMIVGAARDTLQGGPLFRFELGDVGNRGRDHDDDDDSGGHWGKRGRNDPDGAHRSRRNVIVNDPRLRDRVADNTAKFDITESESLLFGTGFGIGTDIHTGPNGNVYVVSLSHGTIYEISRRSNRSGRRDSDD